MKVILKTVIVWLWLKFFIIVILKEPISFAQLVFIFLILECTFKLDELAKAITKKLGEESC